LPMADRLYLTEIHAKIDVDTYFPEFEKSEWKENSREKHLSDDNHL
jgi:dihydrofolate reductase